MTFLRHVPRRLIQLACFVGAVEGQKPSHGTVTTIALQGFWLILL
jgi:hypothetical protein